MKSRACVGSLVASICVALAAAGCGVSVPGEPSAPPSTGGSIESPAPTTTRVQPTFASIPITYSPGRSVDRHEIYYSNGQIPLSEGPVESSLGFRVDQSYRDNSELIAQNMKAWRSEGIKPAPFEADGGTGYWHEKEVAAADNLGVAGTERFYVVAKGAVTVTLSMFAPEGVAMTDEARETADQLIRSVRFDESGLTATSSDQQAAPAVPFTFERPSSLPGSNDAEFANAYWARYELDGQMVEVSAQKREDAATDYAEKAGALGDTKANPQDVKEMSSTADTIGKQVDEGIGTAPRHDGGIALWYFLLRKGDLLVEVRSDGGDRSVTQPVQEVVTTIVTSMTFA